MKQLIHNCRIFLAFVLCIPLGLLTLLQGALVLAVDWLGGGDGAE
jgi:hypothetical protein